MNSKSWALHIERIANQGAQQLLTREKELQLAYNYLIKLPQELVILTSPQKRKIVENGVISMGENNLRTQLGEKLEAGT